MSSKLPIVAIVGRANVGKSSLFNRFVDYRQAIVADEPGTTRDAISGLVDTGEQSFWVVDTAGLKTPEDDFEFTIQEQIMQAEESADLLLVVVEAHLPITEEDRRVAKQALKSKKPVFLVANKADKAKKTDYDFSKLGIKERFMVSAVHNQGIEELVEAIAGKLPKTRATRDSVTRLSFIGRPNVGKSSLFNTLLNKQQAVVADVAGTTRDVNRKQLKWHDKTIELLDTAGIRRSGSIARGVEQFSVMRALSAIQESDVCALVLDATELATKLDQKISGMIKDAGRGLIIVVNKWDKVEKDSFTRDQMVSRLQIEMPYVSWAPVIVASAETGQNVAKLMELTDEITERRRNELKTSDLNNWLRNAIMHHPPAGLKNTHPSLKYVTQTDTQPPRFRFFGRNTKYLHWSYKRYLERELRATTDFIGTPLALEFTDNRRDNKPKG